MTRASDGPCDHRKEFDTLLMPMVWRMGQVTNPGEDRVPAVTAARQLAGARRHHAAVAESEKGGLPGSPRWAGGKGEGRGCSQVGAGHKQGRSPGSAEPSEKVAGGSCLLPPSVHAPNTSTLPKMQMLMPGLVKNIKMTGSQRCQTTHARALRLLLP